jgi:hypothetical protein
MLDQDKSIVLDLNTGRYYSLNSTGTFVWQQITLNRPVTEIAAQLAASAGTSAEHAAEDVAAFVAFLAERKLIAESAPIAACPSGDTPPAVCPANYVKPQVEEHEALQRVVASGSGDGYTSYSSGGSHYWYPC